MSWWPVGLALVAIAVILSTTPAGRRLQQRFLGGAGRGERAPREDHDFLLRACSGDHAELERRLADELRRNPSLTEAQTYRRAIRSYMRDRG